MKEFPCPQRVSTLKTAAALAALTLAFTGVVLTPGVTATESGQDFTSQAVANGGDGKFPVYRIPSIVQLTTVI